MQQERRGTVLVTGATGKIGSAVVAELRASGWPVRAAVHRHDDRSAQLGRLGAEVVVADLFDPQQLTAAMRGAARALYVAPFHPHASRGASAFATAAREARIEAIVSLSQWLASPAHPSPLTRHHWVADRLFASIPGVSCTVVNPGFFADNYLRLIGFAAQLGVLPSLTGDSRNAPPSSEDIARVCAAALMDPGAHGGRAFRPTGPELLSAADMAVVLSRVLGRRVRAVAMPMWGFTRAARMQGVPIAELANFPHYVRDHQQGAFAFGAPTDDVATVTGRQPERFETIARRYMDRPEARRTPWNVTKAWLDFMRTPFMPGYDLRGYERHTAEPAPTPLR